MGRRNVDFNTAIDKIAKHHQLAPALEALTHEMAVLRKQNRALIEASQQVVSSWHDTVDHDELAEHHEHVGKLATVIAPFVGKKVKVLKPDKIPSE